MFTDLDDPTPFEPGADLLRRVHDGVAKVRRRRRAQRVLGAVGVVLVVALGLGSLYVVRRDAAIDRVDVATTPSTDGAVNVLLLGVDSLTNPVAADTIVVMRFRADGTVGLLSIPRDLQDPADTAGPYSRINTAITVGLQPMVAAVTNVTGIPIDHVVQLDFDGFIQIVDALGGLRIGVAQRLRDLHVGVDLAPTPCVTLDGENALALVRSRWTQVQNEDGEWVGDPTGDLGRVARAQAITTAVLVQLSGMNPSPADVDRITRVLADHATLDSGLSLRRLTELAGRLLAAGPTGTNLDGLNVEQIRTENGATMQRIVGHPQVLSDYGAPAVGDASQEDGFQPSGGPQLLPCP